MKIKGSQQISVHLPRSVYDELRLKGYELHKSQTKIITEALVLYFELVRQKKELDRIEAEQAKAEVST